MDTANVRQDRVLVFMATYNERDNIRALCDGVLGIDSSYDVLVVDDNSPDGTGPLLDELAAAEPRITVVHRARKMGLGTAHKLAMIHAVNTGYPILVTMDADFSHDPADIPRLIQGLDRADFVIGSRHMSGGEIDYPFYRRSVSIIANFLARSLLSMPLHEFTTSFRAFRVPLLKELDFTKIRTQGYAFFLESLYRIHQHGFDCIEVPIHFRDRMHGASKIPKFEIIRGVGKLLRLFASRLFRHRRAMHTSPRIKMNCHLCEAHYLIEILPEAKRRTGNAPTAGAVACLQCGLIQTQTTDSVPGNQEPPILGVRRRTGRATAKIASASLRRLLPTSGRILEIGPRKKADRKMAPQLAKDRLGIAELEKAVESGIGLKNRAGDTVVSGADGYYDAIILHDLLEILFDPVRTLIVINEALAQGGILCFGFIDIDSWRSRLRAMVHRNSIRAHRFRFSRSTLKQMLGDLGFEMVADCDDGVGEAKMTIVIVCRKVADPDMIKTTTSAAAGEPAATVQKI